jgi:hypothetical protein
MDLLKILIQNPDLLDQELLKPLGNIRHEEFVWRYLDLGNASAARQVLYPRATKATLASRTLKRPEVRVRLVVIRAWLLRETHRQFDGYVSRLEQFSRYMEKVGQGRKALISHVQIGELLGHVKGRKARNALDLHPRS